MTLVTCVTRGAIALAVVLSGVALPVLGAVTVSAASSVESFPVPVGGSFQLSGLGYGHGIGMSQFGAEGMGELGKSYRQILHHYYPGTSFGNTPDDQAIRVSLSGVARRDFGQVAVLVEPHSGLRLVSTGNTTELPTRVKGGAVSGYRVLRMNAALQVRAYNGRRSILVAGGIKGRVRFASAGQQRKSRVTIVAASGSSRTYRGFLDVQRSPGDLLALNNVLLEHYLRSVVSSEVPSSWTAAALQAQAVAARSYALLAQNNARAAGRAYDICDTTYCQVYGSVGTETAPEVAAVRATSGEYLESGGEPAFTMFSSANGGYSVAGGRSYLVAQPDPYDGVVTGSANWGHDWEKSVSATSIEQAWPQIGSLQTLQVQSRDGNGEWGGRVVSVALVGSKATVDISGDSFRWGVGLKSTWWTVTNASTVARMAPRKVRSKPLDRAVRLQWAAPKTNRNVRAYRVTIKPGGGTLRVGAQDHVTKVTGLTNGREYRARVRAVYGSGAGPAASAPVFVPSSSYSYFQPLAPVRLLDSGATPAVDAGGGTSFRVVGAQKAPKSGTRAAVLRVSAESVKKAGRVLAWPMNARDRQVVAATFGAQTGSTGLVTVPVNSTGKISVGSTAKVHSFTVDLLGYYTSSGVGTNSLRTVTARRLVTSATGRGWGGKKLTSGDPVGVRIAGRGDVPDGVRTVIVNLGLIHSTQGASLSVAPPGTPPSLGVGVRAPPRELRTGTTVARLDADGRLWLRLSAGRSDVTVDVLGWFTRQDGSRAGRFRALSPTVVLAEGSDGSLGAGESRKVRVRGGSTGVPLAASAVVIQALAGGTAGSGSLSVTPGAPSQTPVPLVAYGERDVERNLIVVPVGAGGSIRVRASGAAADVSLRVVGWYS